MMQKNLLQSYIAGIRDKSEGQSYSALLGYFFPEFITSFVLYSMLTLVDSWFIADLKCTSIYAVQGITNNLIHLLIKIAESFSVGTIVLCGQYNGVKDFKNVGRSAVSSLWISCITGAFISLFLYGTAHWIYSNYGLDEELINYGASFLKLRALSIFFMFIYFSLVGFLRGIKNTRVPMILFVLGGIVFIFFDYVLIGGRWGFPKMGLQGSALASTIQYGFMLIGTLCYCFFEPNNKKYIFNIIKSFDMQAMYDIISLSWPVMVDKASLAGSKLWLDIMIAPMGVQALASYTIIRGMEQFAFVPAMAFAQVITFLVSNDYKTGNWQGIKSNIKKTIFLSSFMVFTILFIVSLWSRSIIYCFDGEGAFTDFAAQAFNIVSFLVFFDLLQLILSGALRGAANVKLVMWVRLITCLGYFVPISYIIANLPIASSFVKFIMLYGSFYVGNALMSIAYIHKFRNAHESLESDSQRSPAITQVIPAVQQYSDENGTSYSTDKSIAFVTSKQPIREKQQK